MQSSGFTGIDALRIFRSTGLDIPFIMISGTIGEEIAVSALKAGAPFVLVITNKDKGPEEFEMAMPRIEKVIPGGKTVRLKIPALKPGKYPFVGEYHSDTAKAIIVAE